MTKRLSLVRTFVRTSTAVVCIGKEGKDGIHSVRLVRRFHSGRTNKEKGEERAANDARAAWRAA